MMTNRTLLNRSGLAAIAAATALLATPALAQDAAPVAADPAPIVADTPLPAEPAPAPEPATEAASDPLAPAATTTTTTTRTTRTTSPARAVAAPTNRVRAATPVRPTPVATDSTLTPPVPVAQPATPFDPAMVAPVPEPAAAPPVAAAEPSMVDDVLPIAGAAGLGLLALAGAGYAMRRRRRDEDVVVEETFDAPMMARAPVATAPLAAAPLATAAIAKPAFNWGNAPRPAPTSKNWIDDARRGPTPDNPSLSLKKRLQRAAFFDQRERAVASGKADPVSPMAGLPDALSTPAITTTPPARRLDQGVRMTISRSFQPA